MPASAAPQAMPAVYFALAFAAAIGIIGWAFLVWTIGMFCARRIGQPSTERYCQVLFAALLAQFICVGQGFNVAFLEFRRGGIPQFGVFFDNFLPAGICSYVSVAFGFLLVSATSRVVRELPEAFVKMVQDTNAPVA